MFVTDISESQYVTLKLLLCETRTCQANLRDTFVQHNNKSMISESTWRHDIEFTIGTGAKHILRDSYI